MCCQSWISFRNMELKLYFPLLLLMVTTKCSFSNAYAVDESSVDNNGDELSTNPSSDLPGSDGDVYYYYYDNDDNVAEEQDFHYEGGSNFQEFRGAMGRQAPDSTPEQGALKEPKVMQKDRRFKIPEEKFFKEDYPPTQSNGDLMTVAEWDTLREQLTQEWEERTSKLKPTRPLPFCVTGDSFDPHATGFIKVGVFDQPDTEADLESIILKADKNGKTSGAGADILKQIEFFSIHSPESSHKEHPGIGRLNQWLHIVLRMERPVEGLFIQAFMGPLGVPFGEFRDDFECSNPYSDLTKVADPNNHIIPCTLRPMSEATHPTVFLTHTCGEASLAEITQKCDSPRDTFRVHFNWNEFQCHFVSRMQFLIIVVESFKDKKFRHIMTSTYEHSIDSLDGVAYPYYTGWAKLMKCDEKIDILTDSHESKKLTFNSTRSPFDIIVNYEYDNCVRGMSEVKNLPPRSCPPGPLKCKNKLDFNSGGGFDSVMKLQEEQRLLTAIDSKECSRGKFCFHPNETEPEPDRHSGGQKETRQKPDPFKNIEKVVTESTFFGKDGDVGAKSAFIKNVIYVKKRTSSTHGHLMIFACFVMFGIGVFPARYLKETLGVDSEGRKAVLSLGRWMWIHMFSFFVSMTIMWVGFSFVIRLYDNARIPCTEYTSGSLVKLYNSFKLDLMKDPESLKVFHEAINFSPNETQSNNTKNKPKYRPPQDIPLPEKDDETMLSKSCKSTETAILAHQIIGFLAFGFFHLVFFFGLFIAPDTECKATGHFAVGYSGHVLSLACVVPLLTSSGFCITVFILAATLFGIPFLFFGIGAFIQKLEDKNRKILRRKKCPFNEGVKVTSVKTKWSKLKLGTWAALGCVILGIYTGLVVIYEGAYESKEDLTEGMEQLNCPGFICKAPSWRIDAYIYTEYIRNISRS